MPLMLDRRSIRSLFPIGEAMAAAREAFVALSGGDAVMPQRLALPMEEHSGTLLTMPCYMKTAGIVTTKIVSVHEGNPSRHGLPATQAFLALQNAETGELLAIMDAEYLTAMRTAAASALATDLMAPGDAAVLAIFGTGEQARAHLEAMLYVRPIQEAIIVGRDRRRLRAFCEADAGVLLTPEEDGNAAAGRAQIICTATNSTDPLFNGSRVAKGAHINAIGAFTPDMRELDDETVRRSSVVVDLVSAARNGAGDLIRAAFDWDDAVELGDLLTGKVSIQAKELTLFKSVGVAVQDAAAAARVYEAAVGAGAGTEVALD